MDASKRYVWTELRGSITEAAIVLFAAIAVNYKNWLFLPWENRAPGCRQSQCAMYDFGLSGTHERVNQFLVAAEHEAHKRDVTPVSQQAVKS
jgi:hypothetical protein